MRIVGIDPGLHLTGYACVEIARPMAPPALVEGGVFRLDQRASLEDRLRQLFTDLGELLDDVRPELLVVEKIFTHHKHLRTATLMGHARGVVLLAGRLREIEINELAPTEIKKATTGHGHASKHQMQIAVMHQCGLDAPPEPPDVADAIAIALCAGRRLMERSLADATRSPATVSTPSR